MLNIVTFGAPGSGKGTQSKLIAERYNLIHISTGDLLRAEIAAGTQHGRAAEDIIAKGDLAPDAIIFEILSVEVDKNSDAKGFVFDGFPRTLLQAEMFDKMLIEKNQQVTLVINLEVEEDVLIKRLLSRGITSGRDDDNMEVIHNRLEVYRQKTEPILDYYQKSDRLYTIFNDTTIEDCFAQATKQIDNALLKA